MCPSKKREGELDTIYPPSVALASDSSFQSRNRGSLKEEENGFRSMLGGNKVKQSRGEEQSSGSADSVNSGIVHSGYLVKEGGGESGIFSRKSWKRRWFVLTDSGLLKYYVSDKQNVLKGTIYIHGASVTNRSHPKRGTLICIAQAPPSNPRPYIIAGINETDRTKWQSVLNKAKNNTNSGV
jgi:hypothetical protein